MKRILAIPFALAMMSLSPAGLTEDFLSEPGKLHADERFGADLVYFPDDVDQRMAKYDSIMIDEPVIFLSDDSPYKGFKASELAAIADSLRKSFTKGMTEQQVSTGQYKVVDQPGPSVVYLRLALKDLYIKKEKRGLLSYTPVGIVAHGVTDLASDAIDKTILVELSVEAELQDTEFGDILFASVLHRGQHKAHHVKEKEAQWDTPGAIAEAMGRRLACRMDNARLPEAKRTDCLKAIPMK